MMRTGRAKSLDLKERVVAAYERCGHTYAEVAELFRVGQATVSRYLRLKRETGSVARRPHGGGQKRLLSDIDLRRLRSLVERHPDWTTFEFLDAVNATRTRHVSRSTIVRALAALGFTRKKVPGRQGANRRADPGVAPQVL